MDLETFVEYASKFASLQRHVGRAPLIQALDGQPSLHREDADDLADFLDELSEHLEDEQPTLNLADEVRRATRG